MYSAPASDDRKHERDAELPDRGLVERDELQPLEAREVAVERPHQRAELRRDGGNQQVAETEPMSCIGGAFGPGFDQSPCLVAGVRDGKGREGAPKPRALPMCRAEQERGGGTSMRVLQGRGVSRSIAFRNAASSALSASFSF